MKNTFITLMLICESLASSVWANDVTIQSGNLQLTWSESTRSFSLTANMDDGTSVTVFQDSKPKVNYDNAQGVERSFLYIHNRLV